MHIHKTQKKTLNERRGKYTYLHFCCLYVNPRLANVCIYSSSVLLILYTHNFYMQKKVKKKAKEMCARR